MAILLPSSAFNRDGIQSSNYGEQNPHPSQSNAGDK